MLKYAAPAIGAYASTWCARAPTCGMAAVAISSQEAMVESDNSMNGVGNFLLFQARCHWSPPTSSHGALPARVKARRGNQSFGAVWSKLAQAGISPGRSLPPVGLAGRCSDRRCQGWAAYCTSDGWSGSPILSPLVLPTPLRMREECREVTDA